MGFIKMIFGLVIVATLIVAGGWLFLTFNYPSPYDKYGVWDTVNKQLPTALRKFGCDKAKQSNGGAPIEGCESL
jgi:hypothetical protein